MVMKPEPAAEAIRQARKKHPESYTLLLTPQGRRFDQQVAQELAGCSGLILVCGRYEGIDERVREHLVDDELSIGDYVLTGGELAAMLSGNHGAVKEWRRQASLVRTMLNRPDLLMDQPLTRSDMEFMKKLQKDIKTIIGRHSTGS
jgi:tRNA (guanine37-N1)-methyltransferase